MSHDSVTRAGHAILAALLILFSHPALAATIVVDETSCTLVDAIDAANTDAPVGGCTAGSGADTIELTTDVLLTTVNNGDCGAPCFYGETGVPVVESEIAVAGGGFKIERAAGAPPFRLFLVNATLTLDNVVLENGGGWGYPSSGQGGAIANNGDFTLTNGTVANNSAMFGGGIDNRGTATLTDTTVSNNFTYYSGGGIQNSGTLSLTTSTVSGNANYSGGGGIYNGAPDSVVTLTDSSVTDNTAQRGGGIWNGSVLILTDSTVSGNSTQQIQTGTSGGGIYNWGSLTVTSSDISGNTARHGGGIWHLGTATLSETTVLGNTANEGGGISSGGSLTLTQSTVSGNRALTTYPTGQLGRGGGISNSGDLTVTNSTISGNSAIDPSGGGGPQGGNGGGLSSLGTTTLSNTTVSGNSATNGGGGIWLSGSGSVTSTHSIIADSPQGGNCSADIIDGGNNFADDGSCGGGFGAITPGLDFDTALTDNGGPTRTHALLPGSVAIDAAGDCGLDTDQRGFPRDDGACDSGSYESGASIPMSSPWSLALLGAGLLAVLFVFVIQRRRRATPA